MGIKHLSRRLVELWEFLKAPSMIVECGCLALFWSCRRRLLNGWMKRKVNTKRDLKIKIMF